MALRKCGSLLEADASITVIAPRLHPALRELGEQGRVKLRERTYASGDLAGAAIVFTATGDLTVDMEVAREAKGLGIPVDVAGSPDLGTCVSPAVVARGDLIITVSTGGRAPALAGLVRREIEERFGEEYSAVAALFGAIREKLLTENRGAAYNKCLFERLAGHDMPHLYRQRAFAEIDRLLLELLGPGYSHAELGVVEKEPE